MKKKLLLSIFSVLFFTSVFAENYNKLTLDTYVFLKIHENQSIINNQIKSKDYFLQSKNGIEYTKLYVKVNENYSKSQVENLGCKELVKTKSVALLSVPIDKIEQLSAFNFVELIEIAKQPQPFLDKALPSSNVDLVHQGIDLERPYFGEGVIVGILDYGIDFTHPMFLDENGKERIKRAWVPYIHEELMEFAPPPGSFNSGFLLNDLYVDIKSILNFSSNTNYHGTHVLGIAAGSRVEGQKYIHSGIATKSDIAIVELGPHSAATYTYESPTFIEGLAYLFSYADSMKKPIVVNMSFGAGGYPCDGMALRDLVVKEILNENPNGKIVVAGAGNSGNTNMHFENDFSSEIKSVECHLSTTDYYNYAVFTALGEVDKNFSVSIKMVDNNNVDITDSFVFSIPANAETHTDVNITSITNPAKKYSLYIWATKSYSYSHIDYETSGKPILYALMYDLTPGQGSEYMSVRLFADSGIIHCWNETHTHGRPFIIKTEGVEPDSKYTILTPGAIDEVITVGAYVTKDTILSYTEIKTPILQTINDIADFSSKGPLTNGKIKPDITAPGSHIYSAYNRFVSLSNSYQIYIVDKTPNDVHNFFAAQGTSMATPMVAGVVALMLELNPKLTQSEIKDIIRITAINDEYTGNVKENKSTIWGWGKIDAHEIMKQLKLDIEYDEQDFLFNISPNPITDGNANIQVENKTGMPYIINVYDETGKLVYLSSIDTEKQIDLAKLNTGTYFIKLHNHKSKSIQKVVKI